MMHLIILILGICILIAIFLAIKDLIAAIIGIVSIGLIVIFLSMMLTGGTFDYEDISLDTFKTEIVTWFQTEIME